MSAAADDLRRSLRERADAGRSSSGSSPWRSVLRRTGGAVYPKSSLAENVEFFLVAAIIILGIRTYFVQPFKIPTNSMWPSYYGMTAENLAPPAPAPGPLERAFRLVPSAPSAGRRSRRAPARCPCRSSAATRWPTRFGAPAPGSSSRPG